MKKLQWKILNMMEFHIFTHSLINTIELLLKFLSKFALIFSFWRFFFIKACKTYTLWFRSHKSCALQRSTWDEYLQERKNPSENILLRSKSSNFQISIYDYCFQSSHTSRGLLKTSKGFFHKKNVHGIKMLRCLWQQKNFRSLT